MVLLRDNGDLDEEVSVEREWIRSHHVTVFTTMDQIPYPRKRITTGKPKEESVCVRRWLTEAAVWRGKVKCHNSIPLATFLTAASLPTSLSFILSENFIIWLTVYLCICTPIQPLFPKSLKEKVVVKEARAWQNGTKEISELFVAQVTWALREKKLPQLGGLHSTKRGREQQDFISGWD